MFCRGMLTQNLCFLTNQFSLEYHQQTLVDWTRYTRIFAGSYYSGPNYLSHAVSNTTILHVGMRNVNASMLVSPALLMDPNIPKLLLPCYKYWIRSNPEDGLVQTVSSTSHTRVAGHGISLTTLLETPNTPRKLPLSTNSILF